MLKTLLLILGIFLVGGLIYLLRHRKKVLTREKLGRNLILAMLFGVLLPVLLVDGVVNELNAKMQKKEFCGQCHPMQTYIKGLSIDDDEPLAAVHFQNKYVDQDKACYVCHTGYSAFGGLKAKMNGLKHVYVNYFGKVPEKLELYKPYKNSDCLHCHEGARKFMHQKKHLVEDRFLERVRDGSLRCLECHDVGHDNEVQE